MVKSLEHRQFNKQAKTLRGKTERPALPSRVALGAEHPAPAGIQNGCWMNASQSVVQA